MTNASLVGYARASRWAGSPSEHLDEQRAALTTLGVDAVETDALAGRTLRRPGLQAALTPPGAAGVEPAALAGRPPRPPGPRAPPAACREGRAAGIAVTSLDRLSRSLDDLAELFAEARERGFRIVCLSPALDTATAPGALVETVLADANRWGRRTLARERTRTAFEPSQRRRGRPASTPPVLADRIRAMRGGGATLQAICDTLNAESVPTPRGGSHWRPTSLRAILR